MSRSCTRVLNQTSAAIERLCSRIAVRSDDGGKLLDIGCWDGLSSLKYARAAGCKPLGIEIFEEHAAKARDAGVQAEIVDLEKDSFPWEDSSIDVVVMNQVLEHLKNVWNPMSEIRRVLRAGGTLIVSVPNLASLHNRAMLAAGLQPTSIRTLGPHIRSFTMRELRSFVGFGGAFEVQKTLGVGFYPLPARWSPPMNRIWPGASHTSIVVARRTTLDSGEDPWRNWVKAQQEDDIATTFD